MRSKTVLETVNNAPARVCSAASQASMHKPCFSLSLKSTQGRDGAHMENWHVVRGGAVLLWMEAEGAPL